MKVLNFMIGELLTNCYFCFNEAGDCVVIDPGLEGEKIYGKLTERGLNPSYILLTHGHFDHIRGVDFLAKQTGAKVCVHKDDLELLSDREHNVAAYFYGEAAADFPLIHADILLSDGDEIRCGALSFRVIHSPGHTKGSILLQSEDLLFTGDTLFSYGYGRFDFYGGDPARLAESLQKINEMPENYKLYPGHGNSSYLEKQRESIRRYCFELSHIK